MPHYPQTPQETHSAPQLPSPVLTFSNIHTFYNNNNNNNTNNISMNTRYNLETSRNMRTRRNSEHSTNVLSTSSMKSSLTHFQQNKENKEENKEKKEEEEEEEEIQKQKELLNINEISSYKQTVMPCCPTRKVSSIRDNNNNNKQKEKDILISSPSDPEVKKKKKRIKEQTPPSTNSNSPSSLLLLKKSEEIEETITKTNSTPTAYEAALAEYGEKLILITRKQKIAELRRSKEILNRRKAVNEKYNDLSRTASANIPVLLDTVNSEEKKIKKTSNSNNNSRSNSNRALRNRGNKYNIDLDNANNNNNNIFNNIKEKMKSLGISIGNEPQRKLLFDKEEVEVNHLDKSHKVIGTTNKTNNTNPITSSFYASSVIPEKNNKIKNNYRQSLSDYGNTTTQLQSDPYISTIPLLSSLEGFNEPIVEIVNNNNNIDKIDKNNNNEIIEDSLRFIMPRLLTPPRPLRRTCSFNDFSNNNNNNNNITGLNRSRSQNSHNNEYKNTQEKEKEAFIFIKPQKEPRPLPICFSEKVPRSNDILWCAREASFRGKLTDNNCSFPISFTQYYSKEEKEEKEKKYSFNSIVPQYILDGFAQRHLLRLAWQYWRNHLKRKQERRKVYNNMNNNINNNYTLHVIDNNTNTTAAAIEVINTSREREEIAEVYINNNNNNNNNNIDNNKQEETMKDDSRWEELKEWLQEAAAASSSTPS